MKIKERQVLAQIFKVLIGVVYIIPVVMCLLYSIHPNMDFIKGTLTMIPKTPTLENYIYVFKNVPTLTYFKNTFIMIIIIVPCSIVLNMMGAYAFTYYNFPFKNLLFTIFLSSMMVPGEVVIIANYITIQKMGLMNTYLGMTLPSLTGIGGIFMLRQHIKSIPNELWEAAKMDGCGKLKYLWEIIFPLSKSIISAQAISGFIGVYGAYLWPLLVTTDDRYHTIQIGMASLMEGTGSRYGIVLAGAAVSMIIPMTMFVIGQDYIIEGMTAGAVKS